jgi:hypothetical protein
MTNNISGTQSHMSAKFDTVQQKNQFVLFSRYCEYTPRIKFVYKYGCETIPVPIWDNIPPALQEAYFKDIISAAEQAAEKNIYHLDIKKEHLGYDNSKGVLIDWGDAYFYPMSTEFHMTHHPINIQQLLSDPTPEKLENSVKSLLGRLGYELGLYESQDIYTHPDRYSFTALKRYIGL